jgi:signal peptidase I
VFFLHPFFYYYVYGEYGDYSYENKGYIEVNNLGSFNDVYFSCTDYVASNGRVIYGRIGKNVEISDSGILYYSVKLFSWMNKEIDDRPHS